MIGRYVVLVVCLLLATVSLADAKQRWKVVGVYRNPTCHCLGHPCGTKWTEGGVLHRCDAAGAFPRKHRK
jgi:hypothetical protein